MHHNLSLKTPPKVGVSNEKWCKGGAKDILKISILKILFIYKLPKVATLLAPPFPKVATLLAPPFPKVATLLSPPFPKVATLLAPPFPKVDYLVSLVSSLEGTPPRTHPFAVSLVVASLSMRCLTLARRGVSWYLK